MSRCAVCGGPIALVNIDKLRGVVGLTRGWVHVGRFGQIKRRNHAPHVLSGIGGNPNGR